MLVSQQVPGLDYRRLAKNPHSTHNPAPVRHRGGRLITLPISPVIPRPVREGSLLLDTTGLGLRSTPNTGR